MDFDGTNNGTSSIITLLFQMYKLFYFLLDNLDLLICKT